MHDSLSQTFVIRVFAVLFFLCGLLISFFHVLLLGSPDANRLGVVSVGVITAVLGSVVWFLPWRRWPKTATLALLPAILGLIALHNYFSGDPQNYAIFFLVAFTWTGLAHPRGTSIRFTPLFALAYAAPLLASGQALPTVIVPLGFTALTCMVVGETLAWMAEGLRRSQTHLQRAQGVLRHREARFRSLVQNSSDVITIVRADGVIQYQSVSVERVFGYAPTRLLEHRLEEWVHPEDAPQVRAFLEVVLQELEANASVGCRLRHQDGSWRHCETKGVNLAHDPTVSGVVLNTRDVSERKALEEELSRQAFHDSLTGLANRVLFVDRVEHALAQVRRVGAPVAVLFLDLDGFKTINDSLGHAAGDELLVAAAKRLRTCLRPGDTPARLGGDEFAVLVEHLLRPTDATGVADRILDALRAPFTVQGKQVVVRASIGIAVGGSEPDEANDLLRNADVAMYVAKANGKGNYVVFKPRMHAAVMARLDLEADLHRALTCQEFTIHYQPTFELSTGRIIGVEALLRWNHPERGLVYPNDFIPLAEETSLILPLGRWVLSETCRQVRAWQAQHPAESRLQLNVNLSAKQLQQPGLVEEVAEALEESGLEPQCLVLEITESVLMQDTETTIGRLRELKRLGVRLAIDDFGTGYSSLSYIRRFEIDLLKIDKSFFQGIEGTAQEPTVAQAVIHLGRSLGLQIVAEGIESAEQLDLLRAWQCDLAQGHHFAPPMEAAAMEALLNRSLDTTGHVAAGSAEPPADAFACKEGALALPLSQLSDPGPAARARA